VTPRRWIGVAAALGLSVSGIAAKAQQLDLTHGGPIDITARDGIEWHQAERQVIARGDAKAIRGAVTVQADRLTAWYRKKADATADATTAGQKPPAAQQASIGTGTDPGSEGNEIYRLQADGNVRIFTQTDKAVGDKATYDLDQAVLVLTGRNLTLTTPNDVLTARDDLEYWPQKHMAVARGNAVVVTNDAKRVSADTLVAYMHDTPNPPAGTAAPPAAAQPAPKPGASDDPLASSGKVERVEAFGHVSIRTPTDTVTGERGVYVPDTGMARLAGNVRITRGQNQLNGAEADVNMKTGIAKLLASPKSRVSGLVLPNDESNKSLGRDPVATTGSAGAAKAPAPPAPSTPAVSGTPR
jgi:lipopolysaccharide export system protein LptA